MAQNKKTHENPSEAPTRSVGVQRIVSRPARIRGTHPYSFRSGEWAEIVGERMFTPHGMSERPVYECRFDDGVIDYIAISDAPHYEIGC